MLEVEKKRREDMENTMNVTLNLEDGTSNLKMNEIDE